MAGVRDKYLRGAHKDIYYISEEDEKKMLNECQRMRGNDQLELLKWCQNANNDLSGILFFSLITGIGYDYISKRYWIPIARKDFQGYRRKVLDEMYRWILWGEHDDGKMAEKLFGIKRLKHGNTTRRSDADGKNLCERQTGDKRRTFEL